MEATFFYAIKNQQNSTNASSRRMWMPWAGSLWHKGADVATLSKYFITMNLSTNESAVMWDQWETGLDISGDRGIFWDGDQSHPWWVLAYHLVAAATISLWAILWSVQLFGLLTLAKIFRVKEEQEREGMDISKHGETAYPATAWGEHPASLSHIWVFSSIS